MTEGTCKETMQHFDALVDTIRREVQRLDDDEMIVKAISPTSLTASVLSPSTLGYDVRC